MCVLHTHMDSHKKSYFRFVAVSCTLLPMSCFFCLRYVLNCTVRVFKIDAAIRNAFPKCVCGASPPQTGRLLPQIGRLLPRIGKFFLRSGRLLPKSAGFVHTLSFRNTVQLRLHTYLPCLHLGLPRSHLGQPHLCLSWNSGPATGGFSNRSINFKDAYRICDAHWIDYPIAANQCLSTFIHHCLNISLHDPSMETM